VATSSSDNYFRKLKEHAWPFGNLIVVEKQKDEQQGFGTKSGF
jgi:hypothetical protein